MWGEYSWWGEGGLSLDLSVVGVSDWRGLVVVQAVTSAE